MNSGKAEAEAVKIEKAQKALRDSIEQTKRLADEAEKLVRQNRLTIDSSGDKSS